MGVPKLAAEIHFEDGIFSLAASHSGDQVAVGSKGILGLYEVRRGDGETRFAHMASFVVPGEKSYPITDICFSSDGNSLTIKAEDGMRRELSLLEKQNGMLMEISVERISEISAISSHASNSDDQDTPHTDVTDVIEVA